MTAGQLPLEFFPATPRLGQFGARGIAEFEKGPVGPRDPIFQEPAPRAGGPKTEFHPESRLLRRPGAI